jgi:putative spermidine/putrescine transport system permease protein
VSGFRASGAGLARGAVVAAVLAFLILPNLIVIPISFNSTSLLSFPPTGFSFKWYARIVELPGWVDAAITSFVVASITTVTSLVLGSLAAYALVRGDFPGKRILRALILWPIIVPSLVTAVAVFLTFSKVGLTGSILGFVMADTVLAMPFVVIIMTAAIREIDPSYENAAMGLGANRIQAIVKVTLPMALPGVIASALFSFLISFDELLVSLFLSSPRLATLPKKMWDGVRLEIDPTLAAVSTLLVLMNVLVLLAVAWTKRGQRGQPGR